MPREGLTIKEVAERLGVAPITVHKWREKGMFPNAYKVYEGARAPWLIPESDLEGFKKPLMGNPKHRKGKSEEG